MNSLRHKSIKIKQLVGLVLPKNFWFSLIEYEQVLVEFGLTNYQLFYLSYLGAATSLTEVKLVLELKFCLDQCEVCPRDQGLSYQRILKNLSSWINKTKVLSYRTGSLILSYQAKMLSCRQSLRHRLCLSSLILSYQSWMLS